MKFISNSEKETIAFAKTFAKTLKGGDIIGLVGDLGAGKTHFTKGLAKGLGIKNRITSPTFVLMKVYPINKKTTLNPQPSTLNPEIFIHVDAYRLTSEFNPESIGLDEYLNRRDCITIIEWADRIKKNLPKKTKIIKFEIKDNLRIICQTKKIK